MNDKNKITKEAFLAFDTKKQLEMVNNILENGKTEDISKFFDFSYSWLIERFKDKDIFFVGSIRKFIKRENLGALNDSELLEVRALLEDYRAFKSANNYDVRLCAGACSNEPITKSIVIDKPVYDMFHEFYKDVNYINVRDLYTCAIKEFILKYQKK
ncbi:hypothetical protein [Clostridium sp.]|uniref:hypothetical protein n=1 Tax=Clostridium sp. TaxID=1506 RepID=UPI002636A900|nr:hypothetical protein [Clostridium sp.]